MSFARSLTQALGEALAQPLTGDGQSTPAVPVLSSVSVTGNEYQGQTLTANYSLSAGYPAPTASYQWKRGVTNVGTDSSTYTLVAGDVGSTMTCVITVTNSEGSDNDTTAATGTIGVFPSVDTTVTISGTETVGSVLTIGGGTLGGTPTPTALYKWQRSDNGTSGWADISGATSVTYTLVSADENKYVRGQKAGTNVHGTSAYSSSASSGQIAAAPSDAYIENSLSPDTVVDFAGIKNSGVEYYRSGGLDSDADTMLTHTRAGNATMVDSDGNLKWAPHNLVVNSGSPATENITVVSGAGYTVEMTGTGSVALSGAGTGTVTAGSPVTITASTTTLTLTPSGSPSTMWAYRSDLGGMVDNPDTSSSYVATSGAAVYLPRRNAYRYNGTSWVNGGVLLETVAATNLDPNSDDLSAWTTSNTTIAKTQTGADGVANSAHLITSTAANGTALEQITASSADHAWGCLMKRVTGTGTVEVTVDGGTTWVDITSDINTSEYVQVSTGEGITVTNPEFGVRLVTSGDAVSVQVSQLEQTSAFVSAPIPTNGATATRVAETLTLKAASAAHGTDTSWQMQGLLSRGSGQVVDFFTWHQDGSNFVYGRAQDANTQCFCKSGGTNAHTICTGIAAGHLVAFNIAHRIDGSAAAQCAADGTAGTADASGVPAMPPLSDDNVQLMTGDSNARQGAGYIEMIRMWDADIATAGIESATT